MNKNNAVSLKAKIRNIAQEKNITAQVVLQNYMFERFLERLSVSEYKDTFILKGGLLIAAMVGLDTRSTMDMDATIRSYPLDEEHIRRAIEKICAISAGDSIDFQFTGIRPIRDDDNYGGFRVSIKAIYEIINTPLSLDITSGDVITPKPIRRIFKSMLNEEKQFELWTYNVETILAEKIETILRRGEFNTRPRDFYDVYIIAKTQDYDADIFHQAISATANHRGTSEQIKPVLQIISTISASSILKDQWKKYQNKYPYAGEISFEEIISVLEKILLVPGKGNRR
jgi:predicted nucleotidyltransferase component of viral defense system